VEFFNYEACSDIFVIRSGRVIVTTLGFRVLVGRTLIFMFGLYLEHFWRPFSSHWYGWQCGL